MIFTKEEADKSEEIRILNIARERSESRYKNIVLAEDTRRLIEELELMLTDKIYRHDSKTIYIEMMKLTDRFLTLTA